MKTSTYILASIIATSAMAGQSQEAPSYKKPGYILEQVTEANRTEVLVSLSSNKEFKRMRGLKRSCDEIYHLTDTAGQSVGYGSICKTSYENERGFFCWDAAGQYFAYGRKR